MPQASDTARDANEVCQACGLCCNGTLHERLTVYPQEVSSLTIGGFDVKKTTAGKHVVHLGCKFLDGTRCSVYSARPKTCRTYYCDMARNVMNGTVDKDEALSVVSEVKDLASWFEVAISPTIVPPGTTRNYRKQLGDYLKAMRHLNEANSLTDTDKENIRNVFEQIKYLDRYFRKNALLSKFAFLIQSFDAL